MATSAERPARSTSPAAVPAATAPKKPVYSALFDDADGKADIVLRSSNDVHFAVSRALLAVTSSVFDNMLAIPQPPKKKRKSTPSSVEDRDVVQLAEHSVPLEFFLRHVVPQAYLHNERPPALVAPKLLDRIRLLEEVLVMANKYDAPFTADVLARMYIPELIKDSPIYGWVIACEFERVELARDAMRALASTWVDTDLSATMKWDPCAGRWISGRRDHCLGDITRGHLAKLSASAIRNFAFVHAQVVACRDGSYTWHDAAYDFKL